jgi:hypothetical protein
MDIHKLRDVMSAAVGLTSVYILFQNPISVVHACITSRQPVVLGGLVVIVLAIGPKARGFKPGRGDGF